MGESVTLVEFSKTLKTKQVAGLKAVVDTFVLASDVMKQLSFTTTGSLAVEGMRVQSLPAVDWRNVNEQFDEGAYAKLEPFAESVYAFGRPIHIDILLSKATNTVINPVTLQKDAALKAMAYGFNDVFVNGDYTVNHKTLTGLKKRIDIGPASQKLLAASGGLDVDGSDALMYTFVEQMHALEAALPSGSGKVCYFMNKATKLKISSVLRRLKLLDVTKDQWDRQIPEFNGNPFYDIGKKADDTTEIITNTEDPGDGGSDCTSIYAVKFGDEYLRGIQEFPLDVWENPNRVNNGTMEETVITWPVGLHLANPKGIARLYGLIV